jgi:hypothetical protein
MWYLTLREEPKLQVFKKKMFRIICGVKKGEESEQFGVLPNEELHDLYRSPVLGE